MLAFERPLGFANSVSLGVVSAIGRQLAPQSPMIYVQTDAGDPVVVQVQRRGELMYLAFTLE